MDEDKSIVDDDDGSDRDEMNPPDLVPMQIPLDVLRGEAGAEAGREVMQRAMSMILAHAGFSSESIDRRSEEIVLKGA